MSRRPTCRYGIGPAWQFLMHPWVGRLASRLHQTFPPAQPTHSPLVNDRLGWTLRDELTLVLSHDTDSTCRGRQVLERVYPYLFGPWRDAMNKRLPLEDAAASSRPACFFYPVHLASTFCVARSMSIPRLCPNAPPSQRSRLHDGEL